MLAACNLGNEKKNVLKCSNLLNFTTTYNTSSSCSRLLKPVPKNVVGKAKSVIVLIRERYKPTISVIVDKKRGFQRALSAKDVCKQSKQNLNVALRANVQACASKL